MTKKILAAYFSDSNMTAKSAVSLAEAIDADPEQLKQWVNMF